MLTRIKEFFEALVGGSFLLVYLLLSSKAYGVSSLVLVGSILGIGALANYLEQISAGLMRGWSGLFFASVGAIIIFWLHRFTFFSLMDPDEDSL